jgi:ABC-2 type transport system ATP-binding protein
MTTRDAIAFMGALRGLPLDVGRKRAEGLLRDNGLGDYVTKPIKSLSKGMAQTVQLFGTIVHRPKLIVLDEPFSGLDAINQGRLEALIRAEAAEGATVVFSTHVIAHAERLCERIAIIAGGRIRFEGSVAEARDRLRPQVRLRTRAETGSWRGALPPEAEREDGVWHFELPDGGIEPLLRALSTAAPGSRNCRSSGRACTTLSSRSPARPPPAKWPAIRRPSWSPPDMQSLFRSAFVIARRDFVATVWTKYFLAFLFAPL